MSNTKNNKGLTKWQRCGSGLKLSKLLHLIMVVALLKLAVVGVALWDMMPTDLAAATPARVEQTVSSVVNTKSDLAEKDNVPLVVGMVGGPAEAYAAGPGAASDPKAGAGNSASSNANGGKDVPLEREALLRKQEELNRQAKDLAALEKRIDEKLIKLKALEGRIQKMLDEANGAKDKKFKHLVDVYSNMKSKQAAQVLETLDEKIAVKILAGMRGRQAGEILTFVEAKKAAKLSEALTRMQVPFE